jgi:hypothetical protein
LYYPSEAINETIIKYDVDNIEGVAQVMHSMMQLYSERALSMDAQRLNFVIIRVGLFSLKSLSLDFGNLKMWIVMM